MPEEHRPLDEHNRLRRVQQRLIDLKETGPHSAAWQRARLAALWRLQRRLARLPAAPPSVNPEKPPRSPHSV
ncbi:MAG: hypothetical protein NVS4B8_14790 [Herpetosiphon sp.]